MTRVVSNEYYQEIEEAAISTGAAHLPLAIEPVPTPDTSQFHDWLLAEEAEPQSPATNQFEEYVRAQGLVVMPPATSHHDWLLAEEAEPQSPATNQFEYWLPAEEAEWSPGLGSA